MTDKRHRALEVAEINAEILRLRRDLAFLELQGRNLVKLKQKEGAGDGKQG